MLHEQQRADGVDGEGAGQVGVVELRGRLFRVKDAWDGKGEVQVVV